MSGLGLPIPRYVAPPPIERRCGTCRYWDRLSLTSRKGDCRAPGDHRYWRVPMPNGTYALADDFGQAEMAASDSCGAWDR